LKAIRWGIIGCGDVCEIKSGPAFNKVDDSRLVAVMRRDLAKAEDFARRHGVPKFYNDAEQLIRDPDINAIYIATPPSSHEMYLEMALREGKPVYVEKPVSTDADCCERMIGFSRKYSGRVSVAHYRRGLPLYREVKRMIGEGIIGKVLLVDIKVLKTPVQPNADLWRVDPSISGGGFFHDLSPHQLDILLWIFGEPLRTSGQSKNILKHYNAPDLVTVEAEYSSGVKLRGVWAFNVSESEALEKCEIIGEKGKISFSFFKNSDLELSTDQGNQIVAMQYPENIQQPMIDAVTKYFLKMGPNPCSLEEALVGMKMIDATV
jgi:1,5-anhydro-D-fructose reductase (1,5-anhydro-D-mannitol-forming)